LHENEDLAGKILRALDAAERGASLTQRLLAFSRQQALQPEVVDVNHLVLGLVDLVGYSMGTGIEIKTDLSPRLGPMLVDPGQLENALLNLIFNSRDALPKGGMIRVATFRTPASDGSNGGESISVSVSDNGVGMTSEVLARAYEPFFTTKGKERGSGLGLSMVYGFAKQSGGQINISSAIGVGTEVTISLPRADYGAIAREARSGRGAISAGHESVLIVEDDPAVRATTADMVRSLGYRAKAVSDGIEAIAELEREAFDLLLTDVVLPNGLSGPEVATRAERVRPGIGVLYTSGYALDSLRRGAPLPGNAKLLEKPFRKERLAQAIRQALDHYRSYPTLSTSAPNL
jgi:CheY-like chemotaxis protein